MKLVSHQACDGPLIFECLIRCRRSALERPTTPAVVPEPTGVLPCGRAQFTCKTAGRSSLLKTRWLCKQNRQCGHASRCNPTPTRLVSSSDSRMMYRSLVEHRTTRLARQEESAKGRWHCTVHCAPAAAVPNQSLMRLGRLRLDGYARRLGRVLKIRARHSRER